MVATLRITALGRWQLSLSMVKVDVHVLSGTLRGGISARCWFTCIHVDKAPTFWPCVGKEDIAEGKREWHQGKEERRERERERKT